LTTVVAQMRALLVGPDSSTPQADAPVLDRRRIPRRTYRSTSAADRLTRAAAAALTAGARRVLVALPATDGTTASLAIATGLNRRTVENALLVLRREGLVEGENYRPA
jgi:hypothetical protein